jgi:hypothetical protein
LQEAGPCLTMMSTPKNSKVRAVMLHNCSRGYHIL